MFLCFGCRLWDEHEWVAAKLPSNYHRDHQLLKAPLFRGVAELRELLEVAAMLPGHLSVDTARVSEAMTADLDAARLASEQALEGKSFRLVAFCGGFR